MNRTILGSGFACALAVAASAVAQNPPQNPTQNPPAQPPAAQTAPADRMQPPAGMVSIEGCLVKEVDVPGRKPPAEMQSRAETDNDFVLIDTKTIKGTDARATPSEPSTPVGTSGVTTAGLMYEVQGLEKAQLTEHAGHRVQIDGTLEHTDRAKNPVSFANDLVDLRGTTIRPVAGDCPKK